MSTHPKGFVQYILFADVETSGICFNSDDPSYNTNTGESYQTVSIGLLVVNSQTLKVLDKLYLEIQPNGTSLWNVKAEAVHGLSQQYLMQHGVSEEDAVVEIAELILKYWGPDSPVCLGGHNVGTFDKYFIRRLLRSHGIEVKWGSKVVDTNSIGFATFATHNSDDLFAQVGLPDRDPSGHNALVDANNALEAVRVIRQIFQQAIE